jgi:hypothetical protein
MLYLPVHINKPPQQKSKTVNQFIQYGRPNQYGMVEEKEKRKKRKRPHKVP